MSSSASYPLPTGTSAPTARTGTRRYFRDAVREVSPPWLRGGTGGAILGAIAEQLDDLTDRLVAGVRARFPGLSAADALPLIGRERRIRRGRLETDAVYTSRLGRWLDDHRRRGGAYALLAQLHAHYAPAAFPIVLRYASGRVYDMDVVGVVTRGLAAPAGAPSPGALQPIAYDPVGAWALGDASGLAFEDRTGHGRTGSAWSDPVAVPDTLRPGEYALGEGGMYLGDEPAARIAGALTVTLRVRLTDASVDRTFVQCATQGNDTVEADNILYELGCSAGTGALYYFAEEGPGTNIIRSSTLTLTLGTWHVVTLRRADNGDVTFDLDDTSETIAGVPLPTGGTTGTLYVGDDVAGLAFNDTGRELKDVVIWDRRLTDEQLAAQRAGGAVWTPPGDPAKWARWWLFYTWPDPISDDGVWSDPGTWGDGGVWGSSLSPDEVRDLRLVPREWGAAHATGRIVLESPTMTVSISVEGG